MCVIYIHDSFCYTMIEERQVKLSFAFFKVENWPYGLALCKSTFYLFPNLIEEKKYYLLHVTYQKLLITISLSDLGAKVIIIHTHHVHV